MSHSITVVLFYLTISCSIGWDTDIVLESGERINVVVNEGIEMTHFSEATKENSRVITSQPTADDGSELIKSQPLLEQPNEDLDTVSFTSNDSLTLRESSHTFEGNQNDLIFGNRRLSLNSFSSEHSRASNAPQVEDSETQKEPEEFDPCCSPWCPFLFFADCFI